MEPRKAYRGGHKDSPPGSKEGKADGFYQPEGSSPEDARASVQDPIGVEERGMASQGELGNVGEPPVSLSHSRRGDRVTKGPGVVWGLRPDHEPSGDTTNARKRARDQGASDT